MNVLHLFSSSLSLRVMLNETHRCASRSLFLPAFLMLGQLIGQFDPIELATRVCVVPRRQPFWAIKAARRHVDFVQEVFVLEG
jgi:hypothetical protein